MKNPFSQFWLTSVSVVFAVLENSNSKNLQTIFDDTPVNITAIQGSTAILPCDVLNLGKYEIAWMNPKKILISRGDRRVMDDSRLSIERPLVPDWNLHIRHVQYDDRGMYVCTLNTRPVKVKRLYLSVAVPPNINEFWSSSKQVVKEGSTVELNCNATGVPQPKITWFRKSFYSKHEVKERIGVPGEYLIIHNITRYCDGIYECVAENGVADDVSMEIPVEVEFPPEVHLLNKRMGQYIAKETILVCNISAFPHAMAYWKKGKLTISNKSYKYRVNVYDEDSPHTLQLHLRIMNVQKEDFGEYTCEAYNSLGRDNEKMFLYENVEYTKPDKATQRPYTDSAPQYWDRKNTSPTKMTSPSSDDQYIGFDIPGDPGRIASDPGKIALTDNSAQLLKIPTLNCSISLLIYILAIQLLKCPCS